MQRLFGGESGYGIFTGSYYLSLWFILLLRHALVEQGQREGMIKETKHFFVQACTNSHCFFCTTSKFYDRTTEILVVLWPSKNCSSQCSPFNKKKWLFLQAHNICIFGLFYYFVTLS